MAEAGPGPVPRQCAPGDVPSPGLAFAGTGCLIRGAAGFTIEPKVLHTGEYVTATVTPTNALDSWSWANWQAVGPFGGVKERPCADFTEKQGPDAKMTKEYVTTCTLKVGTEQSPGWEVYVFPVTIPFLGS
ncbi:MAG TPA: hypothetical protein VED59_00930, partial [Acidimicrobiales bacterium]|nr:hypothetical protein [Acidimicrobiales bacterium]